MSETDKSYWLLSETSGIGETRDPSAAAPPAAAGRTRAGSRRAGATSGPVPASSLAYGVGVFLLSVAFVWTLVAFGRDYILFPALAGFMIVAPFLAIGLYEKSRAIEEGRADRPCARCSSCARAPARRSSSRACCSASSCCSGRGRRCSSGRCSSA